MPYVIKMYNVCGEMRVRAMKLAYQSPLYQVLALDAPLSPASVCEISPQLWRERLAQVRAQIKTAR